MGRITLLLVGLTALTACASPPPAESAQTALPRVEAKPEVVVPPAPPPALSAGGNPAAKRLQPDDDPADTEAQPMDNDRLDTIFNELVEAKREQDNVWTLTVAGAELVCITDESHDRMRIVTPVIEAAKLTADQKERILEANFHSALDARYAVHRGVLYSAFIHPLSPLTADQIRSAIAQVVTLAGTFGTSYTSSDLSFGKP